MEKIGKQLIVFDLDGTLAETKSYVKPDMARAITRLLERRKMAVIGGGSLKQFKKQLMSKLRCPPKLLANLFIFPTTATSFYRYRGGWKKVYLHQLSKKEKAQIREAFRAVFEDIHYIPPKKTYGKIIEDRKTQITFSALGQDVVGVLGKKGIRLKKEWTKKNKALKMKIAKLVQKRLPRFEVHAAGYTSIDVARKGIDKAYGIRQIEKHLHVPVKKMLFIGDALFRGGNDYAVRKTGVEAIPVSGPRETKKIIKEIISA